MSLVVSKIYISFTISIKIKGVSASKPERQWNTIIMDTF